MLAPLSSPKALLTCVPKLSPRRSSLNRWLKWKFIPCFGSGRVVGKLIVTKSGSAGRSFASSSSAADACAAVAVASAVGGWAEAGAADEAANVRNSARTVEECRITMRLLEQGRDQRLKC